MQRRSAYDNISFHHVIKGAESEQPAGAPCYQWVGCRESLAFLILGVGRLREDQLIYVETRENVFFIIWDLKWFNFFSGGLHTSPASQLSYAPLVSYDVTSLFTCIPTQEAVNQ